MKLDKVLGYVFLFSSLALIVYKTQELSLHTEELSDRNALVT